ncbi:hypothetical protein SUDANB25_02453 [Streptomyces sp. SudanB25_2051]
MRHVRAVAVFGVVLVALTGARGSGGGSCGGSSSSGSSSSSSGGSGSHSDTDGSGSSSSGGGVSVPGGSSSNSAMRDIKIAECKMDASGKNLVARLTVTNDGSVDYSYDATVHFKGAAGSGTPTAIALLDDLVVPANGTKTAEATAPYSGTQNGSEYSQCVVTKASRNLS